jgi:CRP-like cAMP-binding protein
MNKALLKKIPLFASLDNEALGELSLQLQKETAEPRQVIFWMNEKGDHLYIIQKGKVQISYTDEDGKEIILSVLGPGSFFGELSLIDGGPHTATARAVDETTLLTLDRPAFYRFLDRNTHLAYTILEVLSLRLRANTVRMRGIVNVNEQLEEKRSPFQHFIDWLAKMLTSSAFVTLYILFIVGWMATQIHVYKESHRAPIRFLDTPPTFFILGFLITLTSFVLTVLILNSQRRQAENDRIRGEIEYQVNLKAQTEVVKLQLKMDQLMEVINRPISDQSKNVSGDDSY